MLLTNLIARLNFRRYTRDVYLTPNDVNAHFTRLHAALDLEEVEPIQGALADMLAVLDEEHIKIKQTMFAMVRLRLPRHLLSKFEEAVTNQNLISNTTSLATRWSVLVSPSAQANERSRRCSPDVSKAMAMEVVQAVKKDDFSEQKRFLDHCLTCSDKLAFMLASRLLSKMQLDRPEDWKTVEIWLSQSQAN